MNNAKLIYLVSSLLLLTGCSSITSTQYTANDFKQSGIPYNLPKSVAHMVLKVEQSSINNGFSLLLTPTVEVVPDQTAVYYARPDHNMFTASDTNITLSNGLLNSITSVDDGQLGDAINNTAQLAINLRKISALAGTQQSASGDSPFITSSMYPTIDEVTAIVSMIRGGEFSFPISVDEVWRDVPGTSGMLTIKSVLDQRNASQPSSNVVKDANVVKDTKYRSGVFTRARKTRFADSDAAINLKGLYHHRIKVIEQKIVLSKLRKKDLDTDLKALNKKKKEVCKPTKKQARIDELDRRLIKVSKLARVDQGEQYKNEKTRIESELAELKEPCKSDNDIRLTETAASKVDDKIAHYQKVIALIKQLHSQTSSTERFAISSRRSALALIDESKDLRVPLQRSWIGKTDSAIQFENGLISSFKREKPSEITELTAAAVTGTQTLYGGVKEILEIPQVVLGIQTEEVKAENALADEELALLGKQLEVARTNARVDEIDAQINLVAAETRLEQVLIDPEAYVASLTAESTQGEASEEEDEEAPEQTEPEEPVEDAAESTSEEASGEASADSASKLDSTTQTEISKYLAEIERLQKVVDEAKEALQGFKNLDALIRSDNLSQEN